MSLKPGIWPGELIIEWMVIDMNEARVCSLEQVLQVLAGTQALEFGQAEDDEGRYAWVESVLGRLNYRVLPRGDRGPVLAYLQRLSGYSLAQSTRLVSRWRRSTQVVAGPESVFMARSTSASNATSAAV